MRLIKPERSAWNDDAARFLRELADRVENCEITELSVVWNDRVENGFGAYGMHDDKWRMLGALEYAKGIVITHGHHG